MLSHDELTLCIKLQYPDTKHMVDYFVAMPVDAASGQQTGQAFIAKWNIADTAQPTGQDIEGYESTFATVLSEFRSTQARLARLPNISARQLWLMAKNIGITKSAILTSLDSLADQDEAETLRIELTEPPLNGYERFSPAVERLRLMQSIPEEQFDDLWAWASQIE
ncbi:hypothetical protein FY145_17375 [Agrobacterium tumefaciens]|uniref:Bacteriophage SP-beta YorD domain-containing protein n=1 Tax=Agrobacterium tumefaciens TaxID=358 RepID=A0AAP9E733_AGRTU|nr:hypothetical protein [Agrobacterium tumefaciens]NSZ59571.1 hypothetical protein [Agrobacterium tumefaciens]QDY96022.1 hypothetical protein CG010_017680 [Agrobacterium tumefaciens]UXS46265.1 hypothetical protein FY149_03080 [Agrobacterium tumefaciens]UXS73153.1 hypothetical protein FY146_21845 [Agrobacterium tumefaciens]UXS80012.1 hypothetical protein FY145_17375 [Agrobacterium tumefaciens]